MGAGRASRNDLADLLWERAPRRVAAHHLRAADLEQDKPHDKMLFRKALTAASH